MICSECKAEGEKSKVYPLGGTVNAIHMPDYYDEEGILHIGHPGGHKLFKCSRGHSWTVKHESKYKKVGNADL